MKSMELPNDDVVVEIENLTTSFHIGTGDKAVVSDLSFQVAAGEILALVGESGSGKSITSLSIMGLLPENVAKISAGKIYLRGREISSLDSKEKRKLCGKQMGMIFQEPMTSLNPVMKCGDQVGEMIKNHLHLRKSECHLRVIELFEKVKLPDPQVVFSKYPHELSGGQRQRVMIAMAISCNPTLLIADEPTTALDVTVQQSILELLQSLVRDHRMALLFITHDLGVVRQIADRVAVLYRGELVESGPVGEIFKSAKHPYTRGLIACRPTLGARTSYLPTIADFLEGDPEVSLEDRDQRKFRLKELYDLKPLVRIIGLHKWYRLKKDKRKWFQAVQDVTFDIYPGETLGLVGESGCGKTTLSRTLLLLTESTSGEIWFDGKPLEYSKYPQSLRREMQIIFQDPYSSLNPKINIGKALEEPLIVHQLYPDAQSRKTAVLTMLDKVGMSPDSLEKFPHEFSGGQRQRIAIARALLLKPRFIICDESVSALDVSVQAQVLNLLNELKVEFGLTYLFISHDLSVVKHMSDRIMVMHGGEIVEVQEADALYSDPQTAYTRRLISAIPKA